MFSVNFLQVGLLQLWEL